MRFFASVPPNEERGKAALNLIQDQVDRLDEVLEGIRAFFRTGNETVSAVDVNEVVRRVMDTFREDFAPADIGVRLDLASNLPPIHGNANQLQQVISNLVRNALEAMKATENRPRKLHLRTERDGEDGVGIAVEDTGPGIHPAQLDQAFNAFFTTKAHGMGLGLAMCRLIVERHGGTISASSDGKNGARFNIAMPAQSKSGPD
jgi:signal transduction histidine kinase